MTQDQKTPKPPAASAPSASARRFLAQVMEYCFREGWRTPDDFVKHFPAETMMTALERAPELRVAILAAATGIYEEILRRKSPALAAEDLSLALDEGTTSSLQLLSVFSAEDRVRFLDPRKIWDFLAEDQFWRFDPEAAEEQRQGAADRMSFTLTQAVQERLLTLRDILDGLTYEAVADSLSPDELRTVVRHALVKGRDGIGLNEKVLLEVLPLDKLVRSVPLEHIWNEVVVRRLAVPCGMTDLTREERRKSQSERSPAAYSERPPASYSERPPASYSDRPPAAYAERAAPPPERPPSEPRWSNRPSAAPPPLPPELARAATPPESRPMPPPPPSSQAYFQQREAPSFQQREAPSSRAPEREQSYPLNVAGTSDYVEEDNELTTAAPSVTSLRENSLLPPPMRSGAPPSSPGSAPRNAVFDDFNHPLAAPAYASHAGVPQGPPSSARPNGGPPPFDAQEAENTERQRQRVTEHLRAIGRLPPRHATMPASVLRSIDAMYALLPSATDDIQRKSVMRQAFGNDNHLRVALLGLIELMDSSIDTSDPVIQEAKIEALIKILLFEEQRRKENGRFPAAPFSQRMPSSLPPASMPPSSMGGGYDGRTAEGYYFPQQVTAPPPGGYGGAHVATQRPPPPVLGNVPAYGGSQPPLPNLPADGNPTSRRRTMPPPLPPSYPRG
jgi:hypothetical protein